MRNRTSRFHSDIGPLLKKEEIDVLSISFPHQWPHGTITLAPVSATSSVLGPALRPTAVGTCPSWWSRKV